MIAGGEYMDRVKQGKLGEELVATYLRDVFKLKLETVSEDRDRFEKIDRIVVTKKGNRKKLQIKYRETGDDILVDVYEPFYGECDPRTVPGRDRANCDLYACATAEHVHLIHGNILRGIVDEALVFWRSCGSPQDIYHTLVTDKCVSIRVRKDHFSGRPKLLAFVPPRVIPEKNIWTELMDIDNRTQSKVA